MMLLRSIRQIAVIDLAASGDESFGLFAHPLRRELSSNKIIYLFLRAILDFLCREGVPIWRFAARGDFCLVIVIKREKTLAAVP